MAKNKVSEWSSIPSNNTEVGGIDIAENCAPSGINNAIREIMAQVKDMQAGTDADNFTVGGNLVVTGTTALNGQATTITQAVADSSTKIATTAFVANKIASVSSGVTTFSAGTTGLTPSGSTSGAVTLAGTLSAANGGTGRSTLTANNILLGNGTGQVGLVAPSTSGNVLMSNGTTWVSSPISTITLDTAKAATGTSVTFSGIPSTAKKVTVIFDGVSLNGSGDILVQIGTSGGLSTSGYVSRCGTTVDGGTSSGSSSTTGFIIFQGDAARLLYGSMTIYLITGNTYVSSHSVSCSGSRFGGGAGSVTLSGALSQLAVLGTAGTLDAGTINIMYE